MRSAAVSVGVLKTAANLCPAIQINQCICTVRAQTRISNLVSFNCHIYTHRYIHTYLDRRFLAHCDLALVPVSQFLQARGYSP